MNIGGWDEDQLVRRCKEGSEVAYAELVRRHGPRLYALAARLVGDRASAEDVVQESFIAAFRGIERFEPRPSLAAWLNTIVIRAAGRYAERRQARSGQSLESLLDDEFAVLERMQATRSADDEDPHAAAEAAELRAIVGRAILALPFKYRAAVVTRFVVGMEYVEAAQALAVGLNTYKSLLLRGTRMLREALAPHRDVLELTEALAPTALVEAGVARSTRAGEAATTRRPVRSRVAVHSGDTR